AARLKHFKAVELRVAECSYDQIAKQLGYNDRAAARKAVLSGLAAIPSDNGHRLKKIESLKLQRLWRAIYPHAVGTAKSGPDLAMTDRLLKISQAIRELHGLNPQRSIVQNSNVTNYPMMKVCLQMPNGHIVDASTDRIPALPPAEVIDAQPPQLPP